MQYIIGSDTACLKVRISQIQTKQDGTSALRAIIARTAFHIFCFGHARAFTFKIGLECGLFLLPSPQTATETAEAEKLGESRRKHLWAETCL